MTDSPDVSVPAPPAAPAAATEAAKRYIFVCGCPRSGTTAMWRTLSASSEVVVGVERYALRMHTLTPELFERERFLALEEGDTFYDDLVGFSAYYRAAAQRYAAAKFVGDKSPRLYEHFDNLQQHFPGATVLVMFRNIYDVAASYKRRALDEGDTAWRRDAGVDAAIKDWTHSIKAFNQHRKGMNLIPVCYEKMFSDQRHLEGIFERLGLTIDEAVRGQCDRMITRGRSLETARDRVLSTDEIFEITMRAPIGGYRAIIEQALADEAA
jgi:hypothetical protein